MLWTKLEVSYRVLRLGTRLSEISEGEVFRIKRFMFNFLIIVTSHKQDNKHTNTQLSSSPLFLQVLWTWWKFAPPEGGLGEGWGGTMFTMTLIWLLFGVREERTNKTSALTGPDRSGNKNTNASNTMCR